LADFRQLRRVGRAPSVRFYPLGAGEGQFTSVGLNIGGNPGEHQKTAIDLQDTLDPNSGIGLSVFDIRGVGGDQQGAGLIDCSICAFTGTTSWLGNDAPFMFRSPGYELLASGDQRIGYGLLHLTTNGITLDVPNFAITGNASFVGGTGWASGETACDTLGNCGPVAQTGGVPTGVTVTTNNYIPSSSLPGASPVTWHAITVSGIPGPTGASTFGTNFTTVETYAQASSPTITLGGTATVNLAGGIQSGGTAGVSCPSGITAATVTVKNGVMTHC
jgi:hypothetical protein